MGYRTEPTLAEVQAEADRLVLILKDMIPVEWRVRSVTAIRRFSDDPVKYAEATFFDNADGGGKMFDLEVSTFDLHRRKKWKLGLLTRLSHEFFHAKILVKLLALIKDMAENGYLHSEDEYNKFLNDYEEDCTEAVGGIVHWFGTHYQI